MNEYELLYEIDDNLKKILMVKKKLSKHFRQLKRYRKEVLKLCNKNSKIPDNQRRIFTVKGEENNDNNYWSQVTFSNSNSMYDF